MYSTIIEPRVSETDALGHINNTSLPVWFEAARNPIFKLFTPDMSFTKWTLILVNININYKDQIYFGDNVQIYTWVNRIGTSSLELYQEAYQNDRLCVTGNTVYVNYNLNAHKSTPIPNYIRTELENHMHKKENVK
ncbi:acyl-CoA thioesterase [Oceanobacillus halophilus]|uniref:Acyl-CoA thioesterase n=1 Tax=Oceanobacillus halophilus TaxID=930130 RepID=A0A495A822_9BACI|nr:thioesterase family protein [Oceanobacillus halophilus]RKQ35764.1 acyl-CoA thioesterase [Oceanobacillus halophilus]